LIESSSGPGTSSTPADEREHFTVRPHEKLGPVRNGNEHVASEPRSVHDHGVGHARGGGRTSHVERNVDGPGHEFDLGPGLTPYNGLSRLARDLRGPAVELTLGPSS
jgi:hypothetical protein